MDIGCYPIHTSRFIFGEEPLRVMAVIEHDPEWRIDRLTSAVMEFPSGHSVFTCGTQLVPYQRMQFFGTSGRIEIEIPFNAPPDRPCRIFVDDGSDLFGAGVKTESLPVCDQYTIQGDAFSRAVRGEGPVPVGVENAIHNMEVIDALVRSAQSGGWERPGSA
jgi:predicted dehydrogenase